MQKSPVADQPSTDFYACLVTDLAGLDDNSYNEQTWLGLQRARDTLGIGILVEESDSEWDYASLIAGMIGQGCDVVITTGFLMQEDTETAAYANHNIQFIGVEQEYTDYAPNLTTLRFHEDIGGYLMGTLSIMTTQSGHVCAICAPAEIPVFWRYCEGFRSGVTSQTATQADVVYYEGDLYTALFDTDWAAAQVDTLAAAGCDRFFIGLPLSGDAAFAELAALSTDILPLYGMGIETDVYETLPDAHNNIISSAIKNYSLGVYTMVELALNRDLENGIFYGEMDYALLRNLEDYDTQTIATLLDEIAQNMNSGSLESGVPEVRP